MAFVTSNASPPISSISSSDVIGNGVMVSEPWVVGADSAAGRFASPVIVVAAGLIE